MSSWSVKRVRDVNAGTITGDVVRSLARQYGKPRQQARARIVSFGSDMICSLNYSKLLRGNKYFFGLPDAIISANSYFPSTRFGEFVLLICGSEDRVLVLPRQFVMQMMEGVTSRRLDVFMDGESFILQTTKHPKRDVAGYLNAYPTKQVLSPQENDVNGEQEGPTRVHIRVQYGLIVLGRAEGCGVWMPINDRNLSYQRKAFSGMTIDRMPNLGMDENARRVVQNIDVLWMKRNTIQRAFEIEATTSIYSGLLRLNDLVLAQPNIRVDLNIVAAKRRREKVYTQLLRPSFQSLLPKCGFVAFEDIETCMTRLETFPLAEGARVSGLVRAERFELPDNLVYPEGL
jgi:hypothetical protein